MDGVRKGLGWSVGEHELNRRVIRELLESYWMMTINLFVSLLNNTQRHNQLELNMMKKGFWVILLALCMTISVQAQVIDEGSLKKATGWVNDLQLIEHISPTADATGAPCIEPMSSSSLTKIRSASRRVTLALARKRLRRLEG